jgi:hypothetical protein
MVPLLTDVRWLAFVELLALLERLLTRDDVGRSGLRAAISDGCSEPVLT